LQEAVAKTVVESRLPNSNGYHLHLIKILTMLCILRSKNRSLQDMSREAAPAAKVRDPAPVVPSEALFNGRRALQIEHRGERYTLRITSNEKLILTK